MIQSLPVFEIHSNKIDLKKGGKKVNRNQKQNSKNPKGGFYPFVCVSWGRGSKNLKITLATISPV